VSANRAVQRAAKNVVSLPYGPVLSGCDQPDLGREVKSVRKMWLSLECILLLRWVEVLFV